MKWIKLFNKIGRQPLNIMQHDDVMLKMPDGNQYLLKLVYTDNGSKFHLEIDKKIPSWIPSSVKPRQDRWVIVRDKDGKEYKYHTWNGMLWYSYIVNNIGVIEWRYQ